MGRGRLSALLALAGLWAFVGVAGAAEPSLELDLGRSEVRVYAEGYRLPVGRSVVETDLEGRLARLGYVRVKGRKPRAPGEYFWGNDGFWFYRHGFLRRGEVVPPVLLAVRLAGPAGRIAGPLAAEAGAPPPTEMPTLEPEVIAESLAGDRAPRRPIRLADLPERVWRPLLAIEDARFFSHPGVDYRGVARALLANLVRGGVAQGGSTITQQLIKMRDLTPKRTLGRKVSEAVRALAIEADYSKEEILEGYLNHVYYGHLGGLAIHGLGAAARAYFGKQPADLSLAEAALLAGIIQAPNRLAPDRHAEVAVARRNRVLDRMGELGWASPAEVAAARRQPLRLHLAPPAAPAAPHFVAWVDRVAHEEAPWRLEKGRGVLVETSLDLALQETAEEIVARHLKELRRRFARLRTAPLAAAAVVLDGETGGVLAYVGGDPAAGRGGFDHAREARRQPGSTVKPLVLLEAFEHCGAHGPLAPASRVLDEAVRIDAPGGPWRPANNDGKYRGVVTVRQALAASLNVPFARLGRWCGDEAIARTLRRSGLEVPQPAPPSLVLGAVETTPVALAGAYTVFAAGGEAARPQPVWRIDRPGGTNLERLKPRSTRVAGAESTWLVRDLMREAVESGSARQGAVRGLDLAGKTGTSSERRDAWFAGQAGPVVVVVWVGLDDDASLGLSGAAAAAPIWRELMEKAALSRAAGDSSRPAGLVEAWVDLRSGLRVSGGGRERVRDLFRRGHLPRLDRWWWFDAPESLIQ